MSGRTLIPGVFSPPTIRKMVTYSRWRAMLRLRGSCPAPLSREALIWLRGPESEDDPDVGWEWDEICRYIIVEAARRLPDSVTDDELTPEVVRRLLIAVAEELPGVEGVGFYTPLLRCPTCLSPNSIAPLGTVPAVPRRPPSVPSSAKRAFGKFMRHVK